MSEILTDKPVEVLKQYWGFDSFYKDQEQIIASILQGKNTISLVPTGGGKSLCFQIPALLKEGTCLVISPLIALIEDQVNRLKKMDIPAEGVHSGQDPKIQNQNLFKFSSGQLKLLYISPERLHTESFKGFLKDSKISFIAVDEAHCISQWGYDFRPEYRKICKVKEIFPDIQICAFTATANSKTLRDIKTYLNMDKYDLFRSSFLKSNIRFGIIETESKLKILTLLLKEFKGSGIIYMRSRNGTEILSNKLNSLGYQTLYYHAGMSSDDRISVQHKWLVNDKRIIVSTTAFGMGIDKPDVRFVIHYDLPTSMEEFYQEAGRAGRDRKLSDAVIIYHNKDLLSMKLRDIDSFPTIDQIIKSYRNLKKQYDLRKGLGKEMMVEFNLGNFVKKSGLPKLTTIKAVTELERCGFIEFNINPKHSQSLVKINLNENEIDSLLKSDDTKYRIIKTLIFTTNDIFLVKKPISEKAISNELNIKNVSHHLAELADSGGISYEKKSQNIQFLIKDTENVRLDEHELEFRRNRLTYNYKIVKSYLEFEDCKQKYILNYFGEKLKKKCGICYICLNSKNERFTKSEFHDYSDKIKKILSKGWTEMEDLIYIDTYLCRQKNKQMLKGIIKKGHLQVRGNWLKLTNEW